MLFERVRPLLTQRKFREKGCRLFQLVRGKGPNVAKVHIWRRGGVGPDGIASREFFELDAWAPLRSATRRLHPGVAAADGEEAHVLAAGSQRDP